MKNLSLKICLVIAALLASVGSGFASDLPPCPEYRHPTKSPWMNCFGTYTFASGNKYVGEFRDDKYNGQGTFTFAKSGNKYVGEFKDDKRNGQGTYSYAGGDKYVGEYRDDKRNGQGTYSYGPKSEWAGDKYVGEYKDGNKNGQGTYTHANGEKYDGKWKDNSKNGQGTYTYASGDKYVGDWKDDKLHGQGTYTFASGSKDIGEFKDGKLNGYATSYSSDGSILKEGIWKDDEFQYAKKLSPPVPVAKTPTQDNEIISASSGSGFASDLPDCPEYRHRTKSPWINCFGTFTWSVGDKYVGEFKDDDQHGQGTYTWASGDKYVGEYKDGKRNGQGTFTDADGGKYVGELRDNNYHGQGTYTFADGGKYVGEFRDNKINGQGTEFFADGDKYVGEFVDDKQHGQGTYTFADGSKYVGEYKDNNYHGQGTFTWADGDKYVGEFVDDKQHGQGTYTFGPNSKWAGDKYVGEHKDDKKHGHGTYYFVSGNKFVGEFRDDNFNGLGTKTYANGTVEEGIWKDGDFQYAKKLTPPVPVAKTPTQDDEIISASSGSGFAVSSDGYVITNHHVIEGCQKVVVHTKGKELPVTVVTYDPQNDLALLKGDFRPKTVFPLSNNRPELLQDIYVAGYPFGNKVSTSVKVTKGIISSLTGIGNNFSNIQIDAALQSGNSGGPILDDLGNVVGVAVSKLDAKYMFDNFGSIPENTNFGIKSIIVRSVLDSNEVDSPPANQSEISKSKLGKMISSGTYYISCWMTMAQIEKMKTKKVFFSNLD